MVKMENKRLNPIEMTEILEKILKFLPLPDLKNTRLVNSKWRKESTNLVLKTKFIKVPPEFCNENFQVTPEDLDDLLRNELNDAFHLNFKDGYLNPDNPMHVLFRQTFEQQFRATFQLTLDQQENSKQVKSTQILRPLLASSKTFNLSLGEFIESNFFGGMNLSYEKLKILDIGFCKCFLENDIRKLNLQKLATFLTKLPNLQVLEAPLSILKPDGGESGGFEIEQFLRKKFGWHKLKEIRLAVECHKISPCTLENFVTFATQVKALRSQLINQKLEKGAQSLPLTIQWKLTKIKIEMEPGVSVQVCRQSFENISDILIDLKIYCHNNEEDESNSNFNGANITKDNWYLPISMENLQNLEIDASGHFNNRKFHLVAIQLKNLKSLKISFMSILPLANETVPIKSPQLKSLEHLELETTPYLIKNFKTISKLNCLEYFNLYPNLKSLKINLSRAKSCLIFTEIILAAIFSLKNLERLELSLEFIKEKGKTDEEVTWDQLFSGIEVQDKSIKNLQNLKSLKIIQENWGQGCLTNKFIMNGLIHLKNLQKVYFNFYRNDFTSEAIDTLKRLRGPHFIFLLNLKQD